jgi:hypothetical protein
MEKLFKFKPGFTGINLILLCIAIGSVAYATSLALMHANQLPLDVHAFRQTQTAITAYWFMQEGFKLAYETPVAGAPWSIPFEFPIYQLLVATTSKLFGLPLDFAGRIVSYLFLVLCLIPAKSIMNNLQLPNSVFYIFAAILFSAPVYVYWSRTFMIETTALFFAVAAIKYFFDAMQDGASFKSLSLYVLFITLSVLQKATTGLPVLAFISMMFVIFEIRKTGSIGKFLFSIRPFVVFICFVIPLGVGVAWVFYTDHIKSLNVFGGQITSSALSNWNWGSIEQKFSSDLWIKVLWERVFETNIAGILGVSILLMAFLSRSDLRLKVIVFLSVSLGLIPLLLFTNLHIVHDYYQSANVIFFIFAIAVALGGIIAPAIGMLATISLLAFILISNYVALFGGYMPQIKSVFTKDKPELAVGDILKRELSEEMQFVAFGNDWSSTFGYIAQRKSFTVPGWFKGYEEAKSHPENFVEKDRLGAVVSCNVEKPGLEDLMVWSSDKRVWKIGETHGCYIATPQKSIAGSDPRQVQCQGSIDRAEIEDRNGLRVISFAGWTTMSGGRGVIPQNVFITLSGSGNSPLYYEALKVPRLDVNAHLGISNEIDAGFSRIISANLAPGEYDVGVAQSRGGQLEVCQLHKRIVVNGKTHSEE